MYRDYRGSRGAGLGSSVKLSEREGKRCSTGIVSAENELERARLSESLTNALNQYKVPVRNLEKLEEKELSATGVLQRLKRVKQDL